MRIHADKIKIYLFMLWLVQSHQSLLELGEEDNFEDLEYKKLYEVALKIIKDNPHYTKSNNYTTIANRLNHCITRLKRAVVDEVEKQGCFLMMLIVGALRHCDIERLQGFDELKGVDLDLIIANAREGKYLNSWKIQSACRDFKFFFWKS